MRPGYGCPWTRKNIRRPRSTRQSWMGHAGPWRRSAWPLRRAVGSWPCCSLPGSSGARSRRDSWSLRTRSPSRSARRPSCWASACWDAWWRSACRCCCYPLGALIARSFGARLTGPLFGAWYCGVVAILCLAPSGVRVEHPTLWEARCWAGLFAAAAILGQLAGFFCRPERSRLLWSEALRGEGQLPQVRLKAMLAGVAWLSAALALMRHVPHVQGHEAWYVALLLVQPCTACVRAPDRGEVAPRTPRGSAAGHSLGVYRERRAADVAADHPRHAGTGRGSGMARGVVESTCVRFTCNARLLMSVRVEGAPLGVGRVAAD